MSVQNFECQIAKAQMGRYIAGEPLSSEAVVQLEDHIAGCDTCREALAQRRASLEAMLGLGESDREPVRAAVQAPQPEAKPLGGLLKLKALDQFKSAPRVAAKLQPANRSQAKAKTAMYSVALAAVLIAMSYLSKNPDLIFGKKASSLPAASGGTVAVPGPTTSTEPTSSNTESTTTNNVAASTESESTSTPPATDQTQIDRKDALANMPDANVAASKPVQEPREQHSAAPSATVTHPAPPKVTVHRSTSKKSTRKIHRRKTSAGRKAAPKPKSTTTNTIRVYDANGNPIH